MNLRSINLNLLPVLRALLRDRSVSQAADSLAMSPSATSESLSRLRAILGDELLVQVGRSMQLTRRGIELIEPVERLCAELEGVLVPTAFDPGSLRRNFVIATLDFIALSAASALTAALQHEAPGVSLEFIDLSPELESRIIAGEIDLAIMDPGFWIGTERGRALHATPLPPDYFVAMFHRSHPLAKAAVLTAEDLTRHPHIGFGMDRKHGEHPHYPAGAHVPIRVQNHMLMPMLLDSRYLALAPRLFVQQVTGLGLLPIEVRELPGDAMNYKLFVHWGPAHHRDPAHRWLRQQLTSAMSSALLALQPARAS